MVIICTLTLLIKTTLNLKTPCFIFYRFVWRLIVFAVKKKKATVHLIELNLQNVIYSCYYLHSNITY